jgi:hypothetical protein
MPTGSYIGHQIIQIFHTGARAAGSMKGDSDKEGKGGGWIDGVVGFLFVTIARAGAAVILVPLHATVALFQPNQPKAATVTRAIVLLISLVVFSALFMIVSRARW